MAKYDPLRDELVRVGSPRIVLSFSEIEQLVGTLPESARTYDWWWDNEDWRTTRHAQCKSWGAAGYEAKVDLQRQMVAFTRK